MMKWELVIMSADRSEMQAIRVHADKMELDKNRCIKFSHSGDREPFLIYNKDVWVSVRKADVGPLVEVIDVRTVPTAVPGAKRRKPKAPSGAAEPIPSSSEEQPFLQPEPGEDGNGGPGFASEG